MNINNDFGAPDAFVRAVTDDSYSKGEADFSVTGLIQPPQISRLKEEHADKINQLINGKTPLIEWYKSSRKHVTHWIANNKKMKLDETDLDASDEYPITWCPGAMPGDVRVLSGIACCVSEAKIRAEEEEWPTDQEESKWKHILVKFIKEVYPETAEEAAWERLRLINGRYRLAFAGLLGKHGANTHALMDASEPAGSPQI